MQQGLNKGLLFLLAAAGIYIVYLHRQTAKTYYPLSLIESAVAYQTRYDDGFLPKCGLLPEGMLVKDSVNLSKNQWTKLIRITNKGGDRGGLIAICRYADFVVVFYGANNRRVSHLTVSFRCGKIIYSDNMADRLLTKRVESQLKKWYQEVFGYEWVDEF